MKQNVKRRAMAAREKINNMTDEEVIKIMTILDNVNSLERDITAYEDRNLESIWWRQGWNACVKKIKGE